jgi:death-on-curing protein
VVVDFLSEDDVLDLYCALIGAPVLRDRAAFASAVNRPRQSAFGQDAYPTLFSKAAALMQSLAENQAFLDGNKRIAWIATKAFLHLNGYRLQVEPHEGDRYFRKRVAGGDDVVTVARWIEQHASPLSGPS